MELNWESFVLGLDYRIPTWRQFDHSLLEQHLVRGSAAGIQVLRLPLIWAEFQPDPNRLSDSCLRDLEAVMNTCAAFQMRLLPDVFAPLPGDSPFPPWIPQDSAAVVESQLRMLETLVSYFRAHRALLAWELDAASVSTMGLAPAWHDQVFSALREWDSLHPLVFGMKDNDLLRGERDLLAGLAADADFITMEWSGAFHLAPLVAALVWRLIEKRSFFIMGQLPMTDPVMQERLRMLPKAGALGVFTPITINGGELPEFVWKALVQASGAAWKVKPEPRFVALEPEDFYLDPEASWQTLYRVWEDRW